MEDGELSDNIVKTEIINRDFNKEQTRNNDQTERNTIQAKNIEKTSTHNDDTEKEKVAKVLPNTTANNALEEHANKTLIYERDVSVNEDSDTNTVTKQTLSSLKNINLTEEDLTEETKDRKVADINTEQTPDKVNEAERRERRINFKLEEVVQAYQEALNRKLKSIAMKKETQCNKTDAGESSESGMALWRKAKASFLDKKATKFTVTTDNNDTLDGEATQEATQKVKFHKWTRAHASRKRSSGYAARRKSITELQNALRKKLVLLRFRRIARLVIFCRRCVQDHCFKFRECSELTPYMQTLNYMDYRAEQVTDLMFDRSKFRADRQMRISEETKTILSKRKTNRTTQEIYTAQIALRNNRSFAEFPARMQRMIAECGHYEAYEAKRVITREGHPPAAFYFVLSGAVVAMQLDQGRNMASAIAEFVKGDTFEEKPMLNGTPRQCTVLTKEPCEFLSISEKDYKNIFMQGGVKTLNDPDQETFLKSLSCLEGWPIKILPKHPTKTLFHYYKRGAVLAMDTQQSDWLIIVKSGSLSVLKKLRRVGPYEWRKKVIKPLTEKEKRERQEQRTQWRRFVLPEFKLPLRKNKEVEEIEELIDGRPKPFQHPDIKVQFEDGGAKKKGKKYCYPSLWTYKKGVEDEDKEQQQAFSNINKQYLYLISSTGDKNQQKSSRHSATQKLERITSKESAKQSIIEERPMTSPVLSEGTMASSLSASPEPHTSSSLSSLIGSTEFDERIRNIMEDVYAETQKTAESCSEVDLKPQFVNVQTLVKGQVWGLADLILEDQASFTVVSNGADCVLINKQFYLEHASEKLLRKMRQDLCPYPSDDELQQGLQVSVDWNDYRQNELTATMGVVKGKRIMRDIVLRGSAVQDTC